MDRRTLLRAGAATAWSVPLVQAATAAPAFAAVSGPASLSTTSGTITRANGLYTISIIVRNSGGSATQGLQAVLTSSPAPIQSSSNPIGWSSSGPSSWTTTQEIQAGGSKSFEMTFTVNKGHVGKANTVTVTFTSSAPGVPPTTGASSQSFPATA
jgi:hypothetical protein